MAPNVYIWFGESDFISITQSGYLNEFEIKLSRSDFTKDFKKGYSGIMFEPRTLFNPNGRVTKNVCRKHEVLSGKIHKESVPKKFYFVVPKDMLSVDDVPSYAGLIHVGEDQYNPVVYPWVPTVVKQAPNIKGAKPISDKQKNKIMVSLSYRFWEHYFKEMEV